MKEYLTTTSAARIAGVGVSSIKRWADEGKLRTVRTPGGHRRLIHSDLVAFLKDPELHASLPVKENVGNEWADAILKLEFHALQAKLMATRGENGSWYQTMDELALGIQETGNRWANQTISIAQEHIATERLSRVLSAVYESIPFTPSAPLCLLAGVEGDVHTLGLSMLRVSLRELGWRTIWLGAMTPIAEVCDVLEVQDIDMVALSASRSSADSMSLEKQLDRVSLACKQTNTRLILGGQGAWPDSISFGQRLHSFGSLASLIQSIQ